MNFSRTRWRLLSLLAALSLCAVLVQAATASPGQRPQPTDASLAPALAVNSGAQEALKVAYANDPVTTTSSTFLTVPGTVVGLTIPSGHTDLLLMRFTAESSCSGSVNGYCLLRILVDNTVANPTAQNSYAFDTRASFDGSESHAVERSLCVGPGTHTVQVQFSTTSSYITFYLDDWHLSVERSHGCS